MNEISLTSGIRANLLSLSDTTDKIARSQERLASGKKVNSALDSPTNFFAALSLQNAAADIDQLHYAIGENINVLKAARGGLESIDSLLQSMKGIVSAAEMTSDPIARQALARSFDETYAQLNYISKDSGYAGTNLISNNSADPLIVASKNLTIPLNAQGSADYVVAGQFMGSGYVLHETPGGQPAWVTNDRGDYVTGYGTPPVGSVGNLSDVALVIRFDPQLNSNGDLNSDGLLQAGEGTEIDFRLTNTGSTPATGVSFSNATITTGWGFSFNTNAFFSDVAPGATVITDMGSDLDLNIPPGTDGVQFSISLDFTSDGVTKNLTFGPLTVGNILNNQTLTANGVAIIPGNPTVYTGTLQVDTADYENGIFGVTFPGPPVTQKTLYAEKQGVQVYHSWVYGRFQNQPGIDAAKNDIQNAILMVRDYSVAMGTSSGIVTIRNEFNGTLANVYMEGADNLTLADMNEEAANILMLQTRQQLGLSSLSLASKSAQEVLKVLT